MLWFLSVSYIVYTLSHLFCSFVLLNNFLFVFLCIILDLQLYINKTYYYTKGKAENSREREREREREDGGRERYCLMTYLTCGVPIA